MRDRGLTLLAEVEQQINDGLQDTLGRMARVVSSDGHMVTVEVPRSGGWDGPLGPYPATVAALGVGAMGILQPLRGNQYLFIASGVAPIVPFTWQDGSGGFSTTSLTTPTMTIQEAITLTPGTWEIHATFGCYLSRSVDSPSSRLVSVVDGVVNTWTPSTRNYDENNLVVRVRAATVVVTETREVPIAQGFHGVNNAATTSCLYPYIQGQALKVG